MDRYCISFITQNNFILQKVPGLLKGKLKLDVTTMINNEAITLNLILDDNKPAIFSYPGNKILLNNLLVLLYRNCLISFIIITNWVIWYISIKWSNKYS